MTAQEAEQLLDAIGTYIETGRVMLATEREEDLSAIEAHAQQLLQGVARLSPADIAACKDRIDTLIRELTALGEQLRARKQDLQQSMSDTPRLRQAHTAYLRADGVKPPEPEE